ncbi:extracellular matrix-binding protein ebh-like [Xenia sp. Carnegie-2017]|uniref:extracellular matrix-binding protein ebh-like n=1 Tax=Xenia sp. Carnegie-2017 TaxID=2897299 RepID=UPI001F03D9B7|nr:extracellular matrix-binding protein ebh-like [Xenia sp. Carnegie-2017]
MGLQFKHHGLNERKSDFEHECLESNVTMLAYELSVAVEPAGNEIEDDRDDIEVAINEIEDARNDAEVAINDTEDARNEIEDARNDAEVAINDTEDARNDIEDVINDTEDVTNEIGDARNDAEVAINNTEDARNDTEDAINDTEGIINDTEDAINDTQDARNDTEDVINDTEDAINDTQDARNDTEDAINDIEDARNDIEDVINDTEDVINEIGDARNDAEVAINDTEDARNEIEDARNDAEVAINDTEDARNDIEDVINDTEDVINEIGDARNDAEVAINDTEDARNDTEDAINDTEGIINDTEDAINDTQDARNDTEDAINDIEDARNDIEDVINDTEDVINEIGDARNDAEVAINDTEDARNEIEDARNDAEVAINDTEDARNEIEDARNDAEVAINDTEDARNDIEDVVNDTEDVINEIGDARNDAEVAINDTEDARNDTEDAINEIEDAINEIEDAKNGTEDAINETEEAKNNADNAINEIYDARNENGDERNDAGNAINEIEYARNDIVDARNEIEGVINKIEDVINRIEDTRNETEDARNATDDAMNEIDDTINEIENKRNEAVDGRMCAEAFVELTNKYVESDKNISAYERLKPSVEDVKNSEGEKYMQLNKYLKQENIIMTKIFEFQHQLQKLGMGSMDNEINFILSQEVAKKFNDLLKEVDETIDNVEEGKMLHGEQKALIQRLKSIRDVCNEIKNHFSRPFDKNVGESCDELVKAVPLPQLSFYRGNCPINCDGERNGIKDYIDVDENIDSNEKQQQNLEEMFQENSVKDHSREAEEIPQKTENFSTETFRELCVKHNALNLANECRETVEEGFSEMTADDETFDEVSSDVIYLNGVDSPDDSHETDLNKPKGLGEINEKQTEGLTQVYEHYFSTDAINETEKEKRGVTAKDKETTGITSTDHGVSAVAVKTLASHAEERSTACVESLSDDKSVSTHSLDNNELTICNGCIHELPKRSLLKEVIEDVERMCRNIEDICGKPLVLSLDGVKIEKELTELTKCSLAVKDQEKNLEKMESLHDDKLIEEALFSLRSHRMELEKREEEFAVFLPILNHVQKTLEESEESLSFDAVLENKVEREILHDRMMQVEKCAREIEQLWLYLPKNETELLGRLAESLKAELNGRIALLNEKERKRVDFESKLDAVKRKLVIVEEFLGKMALI